MYYHFVLLSPTNTRRSGAIDPDDGARFGNLLVNNNNNNNNTATMDVDWNLASVNPGEDVVDPARTTTTMTMRNDDEILIPLEPDTEESFINDGKRNPNDHEHTYSTGIHLITTFFRGKYSPERFEEILEVLRKNLRNPYITRVHVLWEDESPAGYLQSAAGADASARSPPPTDAERAKLVLTRVPSQPTYLQLFSYVDRTLRRGSIAVLANGDIYFDDSLSCLRNVTPDSKRYRWDRTMGKRPFFSLTRRHAPECGRQKDYKRIFDLCEAYIGSHDVFVFAPPVSPRVYRSLNHTQNQGLGAENVVIWELNNSGEWRGMNPCDLIKSYHLHCTNERAYSVVDDATGRRVFLSGKRFNNGTWKHGWIKPWHWRKTITCGYEMF